MKIGYMGLERRKLVRRNGKDRRVNPYIHSDPDERKWGRRSRKNRRKE